MSRRWRVGIVHDTAQKTKGGHGTHLAFAGLPGVKRILVDSNKDNLESRMRVMGADRHYTEFQSMLNEESPDIVVICSRLPGDHLELVRAATAHGANILCEKPLAASLEEADAMAALAKAHGIKIAVAHLARYALVFRTMKRLIQEGVIGTPLTFLGRGKEDERGGGEDMMVLGTHILDLGVSIFGAPEQIFADVRVQGRPITASDRCETTEPIGLCAGDQIWASLRFPGGVQGVFESRRHLCTGPVRMGVAVVGSEGTLCVRYDRKRALRISRSPLPLEDESCYEEIELHEDRIWPEGTLPFEEQNFPAHPTHFFANANRFAALDLMQAIEEDRAPACSVTDAVTTLEMIYGIYASSLTRSAVTLPLNDRAHPLGD